MEAPKYQDLQSLLQGGGITCHIKFSQCSRRWGMLPHSNLWHTQQVLTSRLGLDGSQSNSSGRQCLIRMHTHSSDPILVLPGSQVLPHHLLACQSRGSLENCCRDVGKLKGAWDILLPESEPVLPYSYADCCCRSMKSVCLASRLPARNCC